VQSADTAQSAFASCLTKPIKPIQLHETLVRVVSGVKPVKQAAGPSKLDPQLAARLPMTVLVCDDNVVNQKVAMRILQQLGYRPDVAADGRQALAAIDRKPYDLIFMDVMMPEMDGMEATRTIRERQRDRGNNPNYKTPIIIVAMTANAMHGDREKCLSAGMDDYIAKPVRPEDVRMVVERWGPGAGTGGPAGVIAPATVAPTAPAAPAAPKDQPPVEMERLTDLTDGNEENLRELVELYMKQTAEQIEQIRAAVQANRTDEVRRVAHSCAGASATCGIRHMVPLLRELERQGQEGKLTNAQPLSEQAAVEFERVCAFLTARLNLTPAPAVQGNT